MDALRLRPGHARGADPAAPGLHGPFQDLVDRRAGHPVLASHRAPAPADPGAVGDVPGRAGRAHQRHPARDPPRVELHLFYNAVVFAPMVVAMVLHRRPRLEERAVMRCDCALQPA
ncbi:hypothetical protein ACFSTC_20530 [Nonomuraea ferruginea]